MGTDRSREIDEAASVWFAHRLSGQWSDADAARFDEWLRASTRNRVAYLRLESAWDDAARLKALGAGVQRALPPRPGTWNLTPFFDARGAREVEEHTASEPVTTSNESIVPSAASHVQRREHRRVFARVAIIVLCFAIAAGAYYLRPAGHAYETAIGGIASVPMTDGSKVTLNTDSRIRVDLTDHARHIDLRKGEAFFEVAPAPGWPFIVEAGNKRVVAVGTKFAVRRGADDEIQVVVTEGTVRIDEGAAPSRFINAGGIARATDAGVLVETKAVPDAEEQLSWRSGTLIFRDRTLAEAAAEFNRYNTRQIVIEDPAIEALRIEGNFRATSVDAFARLLEKAYPVRVEQRGDRILLATRAQ